MSTKKTITTKSPLATLKELVEHKDPLSQMIDSLGARNALDAINKAYYKGFEDGEQCKRLSGEF